MLSYFFGKRLLLGLVTIWFIASATFFGMHAVPGDPLAGDKAMTPQIRAREPRSEVWARPTIEHSIFDLSGQHRTR